MIAIKTRDKLKLKSNKSPHDEQKKEMYKKYRNYLTNLLRLAKNNYYDNQLNHAYGNPRKQWRLLREAANMSKSNTPKSINSLKIDDKEISFKKDSKSVCDVLNRHFSTVGEKLAATCQKTIPNRKYSKSKKLNKRLKNSLFFEPVTKYEVQEFINSLRGGSAPGWDCYSAELLKLT